MEQKFVGLVKEWGGFKIRPMYYFQIANMYQNVPSTNESLSVMDLIFEYNQNNGVLTPTISGLYPQLG